MEQKVLSFECVVNILLDLLNCKKCLKRRVVGLVLYEFSFSDSSLSLELQKG